MDKSFKKTWERIEYSIMVLIIGLLFLHQGADSRLFKHIYKLSYLFLNFYNVMITKSFGVLLLCNTVFNNRCHSWFKGWWLQKGRMIYSNMFLRQRFRCIKFAFERKSEKSNANWILTNQNCALRTCVWFFLICVQTQILCNGAMCHKYQTEYWRKNQF